MDDMEFELKQYEDGCLYHPRDDYKCGYEDGYDAGYDQGRHNGYSGSYHRGDGDGWRRGRELTDEVKDAMWKLAYSGCELTDIIEAFGEVEEYLEIIQCSLSHDLEKEKRRGP